jgi:hypothetical protein
MAPPTSWRGYPVQKDRHAVAEPDQEEDVDDAPQDPGDLAGQPDPAEIGDPRVPAYRGERAFVAVAERRRRRLAALTTGDQLSDIFSLLLGYRRETRHRVVASVNACARPR